MNKKVFCYCKTIGKQCGIGLYTELFSRAHGIGFVKNLAELGGTVPSHLHVQYNYWILPQEEWVDIVRFCKQHAVKLYVTMHDVYMVPRRFYLWLFKRAVTVFRYHLNNLLGKSERNFLPPENNDVMNGWGWISRLKPGVFKSIVKSERLLFEHADRIFVTSETAKTAAQRMGAESVRVLPLALEIYPVSPDFFQKRTANCTSERMAFWGGISGFSTSSTPARKSTMWSCTSIPVSIESPRSLTSAGN